MRGTILITGAAGFLGSSLVAALLNEGFKVIGIDRREYSLLGKNVIDNENLIFMRGQIDNKTNNALKDFNIDGIIHLASQLNNSSSLKFTDYYNGNVNTTSHVIEIAKKQNVEYVVFASTCSIYGKQPTNGFIDETVLPDPTDNYGLTKYIAEKLLEIELQFTPVKIIVLRFTSIFGKNDRYSIVNTFTSLAKQNKDIKAFGNGQRLKNLVYLADAVEIINRAVEKIDELKKHEIFITGGKQSIKVLDLASKLIELLGSKSKLIPIKERASIDWDSNVDISKAQRILGFSPMSVSEGLKQYIKDL